MPTSTLGQEIVELETKYWEAIRDKDAAAALELSDNPCLIAGAQGVRSVDHQAFTRMLEAPTWELREFELSDTMVRVLTDDVAIIGYTVTEQMVVDRRPLTLKAADSSTWVKREGNWVCAQHSESILGDAFGRR